MKKKNLASMAVLVFLCILDLLGSNHLLAHCDGMDGPVVTAAKQALETGDVNLVLIWVSPKDGAEIKNAFRKTLTVRKLDPAAKELADLYFFETLVRIHRAGERQPYTGIKPAGRDLGPAIPTADKALVDHKPEPVYKLIADKIRDGLHEKFNQVMIKKNFKKENVDAGREYIEAYVHFIHYVERLYEVAEGAVPGHSPEGGEGEIHK